MKQIKIWLLAGVLAGCSGSAYQEMMYYDLDSLLNSQKQLLIKKEAQLKKKAFVDGDTATVSYQPDSLEWNNELTFFDKMNINQPILQGVYEESEVGDTQSNLTIRQFLPLDEEGVEVQYLKIYYLKDIRQIKKIEALYSENNPIYTSSRRLTMEFDEVDEKAMLHQYSVSGGQKMVLKDSVSFQVTGIVTTAKF